MGQRVQLHENRKIISLRISWEGYYSKVKEIGCKLLLDKIKIDKIIAIHRGGLIGGVILSHFFGLPLEIIDPENKVCCTVVDRLDNKKNIFLFDDVSDSGKTFLSIKNKLLGVGKEVITASVYVKYGTLFVPDYWLEDIEKNCWLVFPWEVE